MISYEKIFFIIGASSDIGISYIKHLDKEKGKNSLVIAHCRQSIGKLVNLQTKLNHIKMEIIQCDLENPKLVTDMITQIKEKYVCPTHILHLAANKFEHMRIRKLDWKNISKDMEVQVHSIAEIFKAFLPTMVKNNYGRCVIMLSEYTLGKPPKFMINYNIVKYALLGLMKSAAAEYDGSNVCINGISPSMIETSFLSNLDPRQIEMNAQNNAMKRNVLVEEVISGIDFLMSDNSSYVNGINLNISGGNYM
ncbi:MAG TPA: SDR family oxidoreductase [Clostridiales bacterium]|nr:SDR family oxidoreductase [Clostridiales bacterium]